MGLDNMGEYPRHADSPRSSVDLLERELPPLPPLRDLQSAEQCADLEDAELNEFYEFFTGAQRVITTSAAPAIEPQLAPVAPRSRMRRATERVIHVAAIRPVVSLPIGRHARPASISEQSGDLDAASAQRFSGRRAFKLPPVWALTNLAIIAALLIGFMPQILTASAAAGCKWYRVKPGDTLWGLGKANHMSVSKLASANHIQNVNLIYVGQQMCIPMTPMASSNAPAPAPASHAPTYSAPGNVKSFINYTLPYARKASQQTGWPVSVILAQWGLETGWRTKTYTGYNWGNCGAMPNQPMVGGINKPGSPAAFAYAYSPSQGVAEYVHVAHLRYYKNIAPAARNGANAAARALGQSPWDWGHYTNRHDPGSSLINIMRVYNLYYYDTH